MSLPYPYIHTQATSCIGSPVHVLRILYHGHGSPRLSPITQADAREFETQVFGGLTTTTTETFGRPSSRSVFCPLSEAMGEPIETISSQYYPKRTKK